MLGADPERHGDHAFAALDGDHDPPEPAPSTLFPAEQHPRPPAGTLRRVDHPAVPRPGPRGRQLPTLLGTARPARPVIVSSGRCRCLPVQTQAGDDVVVLARPSSVHTAGHSTRIALLERLFEQPTARSRSPAVARAVTRPPRRGQPTAGVPRCRQPIASSCRGTGRARSHGYRNRLPLPACRDRSPPPPGLSPAATATTPPA